MEAESFHMDGWTEGHDEAKNSANTPKSQSLNDI